MPHSSPLEQPHPLYDQKELERKVGQLARQLADRLAHESPLFLCPVNGSLFFLTDLLRAFPGSVEYELIDPITGDEHEAALSDTGRFEGRVAVLVRDLVTTGVVDDLLKVALQKLGCREVVVVALVDIPAERRTRIEPDYAVLTTGRDGILVGYGLKHRGQFGNLPYLGQLANVADLPDDGGEVGAPQE